MAKAPAAGLDLGLPQGIKDGALAYLVVALEARREEQLEADTAEIQKDAEADG